MKPCPFTHLTIGEVVTVYFTGSANCSCGCDLHGKKFEAIYTGHITDERVFDQFAIIDDMRCPDCGERLHTYRQPCRAGGVFDFAAARFRALIDAHEGGRYAWARRAVELDATFGRE